MEETANFFFKWHDYLLLAIMLLCSTSIGLYYGYFKEKDTNIKDFLLGKRDMHIIPIGISISGSLVATMAMVSLPAEVYTYGVSCALIVFTVPLALVIIYVSILPVFYNLQISSVYAYLELRFNVQIRRLASFLYAIHLLTTLPVTMYAAAVSIEQGTGFNPIYVGILLCLVCTLYTAVGGIKAVVWSDCLQLGIMMCSACTVAYIGSANAGGVKQILSEAYETNRFHVDFDFDVTLHDSFWIMLFGNSCFWLKQIGINQVYIQKCLTLPSLAHIKKALVIFALVSVALYSLLSYTGLVMYARFKDCDPLTSGKIKFHDQLVPYYILNISENFPGLPGLFIAGVTSAALSTFSAGTNALASTIFNDFVEPFLPVDLSQRKIGAVIKLTAMLIGVVCTVFVVLLENLGSGVFALTFSLSGITAGPLMGLFFLGLFTRRGNAKGGLAGVFGSMAIMAWITTGAMYYRKNKAIVHETMKISVDGCVYPYNISLATQQTKLEEDFTSPPLIYRVSYYYYVLIGTALVLLIGIPVSWLTKQKKKVREDLLSPVKQWFSRKSELPNPETDVDVTLKFV